MQRNTLEQMTVKALRALAHELGVTGADAYGKAALVDALLAAPATHGAAETMDVAPGAPDGLLAASQPVQPVISGVPVTTMGTLPTCYGETRICLMVQKPGHMYTYWEVTDADLNQARSRTDGNFHMVLRVFEKPGSLFHDIEVFEPVGEWFFTTSLDWQRLQVSIGLRTADGQFVSIASSADVVRPSHRPSTHTDPKWSIQDGEFESIYALSGGTSGRGGSAHIQRVLRGGGSSSGMPLSPLD